MGLIVFLALKYIQSKVVTLPVLEIQSRLRCLHKDFEKLYSIHHEYKAINDHTAVSNPKTNKNPNTKYINHD